MAKYRYQSVGGGWKQEDGRVSWTINAEDVAKVAAATGRKKLRVFIEEVKEKKNEKAPDYSIKAIAGEAGQVQAAPSAKDDGFPF